MLSKKKSIFSEYRWIPPVITLAANFLAYFGTRLFTAGRYHYNLSGPVDSMLPILPWFITVYFGCYLFWAVNFWIQAISEGEKERYQFFTADFYARIVCMVCFMIFPTTNTRPVIAGDGFWEQALRFLYRIDAADNLLPSIHCMSSWTCWIAVRGKKEISLGYRIFSLLMAVLTFVSVLALRQHVILDIAAGVLVSELTWQFSKRTKGYLIYQRVVEAIGSFCGGLLGKRTHHGKEKTTF